MVGMREKNKNEVATIDTYEKQCAKSIREVSRYLSDSINLLSIFAVEQHFKIDFKRLIF